MGIIFTLEKILENLEEVIMKLLVNWRVIVMN